MALLVPHKPVTYYFILLNALLLINTCGIVNDSNFKSLFFTREMVCYTFFMG